MRSAAPTQCRRAHAHIRAQPTYVDAVKCPLRQPISSVFPSYSWYDCPTRSIQLSLGHNDTAKSVPFVHWAVLHIPQSYACPLDRTAHCKPVLSKRDDGSPPPFFFLFSIPSLGFHPSRMSCFPCQGFSPHMLSNLRGRM
jgi:hypothetical protein